MSGGGSLDPAPPPAGNRALRAWLQHVAQSAIDWLDELDATGEDLEDDEREIITEDDLWAVNQ